MKKQLLTLLFSCSLISFGQSGEPIPAVPNPYFSLPSILSGCPQDTAIDIEHFPEWSVYHTVDDLWNGEIDSNFCFNSAEAGIDDLVIKYDELDGARPIVIRSNIVDSTQYHLNQDWVYRCDIRIRKEGANLDLDCADCNKAILGIRTPNSTYSGDSIKYYEFYPEVIDEWGDYYSLVYCFPTEKFADTNHLAEFYMQFTLEEETPGDAKLWIRDVDFNDPNSWTGMAVITDGSIGSCYSGDNTYYLGAWMGSFLIKHDTAAYPGPDAIYPMDFAPIPNVADSQQVTLYVDYGASLNFQPYTEIRGELCEGSTTQRHSVVIENVGGNLCMVPFDEVKMSGDDRYIHRAGKVAFQKGSCMLFENGARMVVGQKATMQYGNKGVGMLALFPGGEILMEKDAQLNFGGALMLVHPDSIKDDHHIYLGVGNRITFLEQSKIRMSHPDSRLIIHNRGGIVDLSGLGPNDKKKVTVLEDHEPLSQVSLVGNPVMNGTLEFDFRSDQPQNLNYTIYDLNGRLIAQNSLSVFGGEHRYQIDISGIQKGCYVLQFDDRTVQSSKFIVSR